MANMLSSPEFLWFCIALDLIELPAIFLQIRAVGIENSLITIATYLSQTVIQLIALPVLGEQARLKEEADDARELEQGRTLTAVHSLVREIHEISEQQTEILNGQNEILDKIAGQSPEHQGDT